MVLQTVAETSIVSVSLEPVIERFPACIYDIEEAGNCFATGCFTATVFHLMRVCELGLTSLANAVNVDPGISSWEKLLRKIREVLDAGSSSHPEGWKENEAFYSEAVSLMYNVKNAWRNSVAHGQKVYDEHRARRIFNAVEGLMAHLSSRLGEVEAPSVIVTAEPETNE